MKVSCLFTVFGTALHVVAFGVQVPGQAIVVERIFKNLDEAFLQGRLINGGNQFNPVIQVAPAPVGAANVG